MGNKVYRFKNFKHPGGWSIHMPFAGGRLDASNTYALKHGGSMSVKRTLDSHFFGYLVDDQQHTGSHLDNATWKLRWTPRGEGYPQNIIGYGMDNPYIPPLQQPKTLLGAIDRHEVIRWTGGPMMYFFMYTMFDILNVLGTGDIWDGYWYNNQRAIGTQLYPKGIHKYFDMFSLMGLWEYSWEWFWILVFDMLMIFTLGIPIDIWTAMFTLSWDGMDRWFFWYFPWALYLNTAWALLADYPSEGQWGMLWN